MNRALLGAIRKGIAARVAGLTEADCPYADHRKPDGRLSWSRAYRNAWFEGFRDTLTQTDRDALAARGEDQGDVGRARPKRLTPCDPPCPIHLCAEMTKIGACLHPDATRKT